MIAPPGERPAISVVVASRNDAHGGNMLGRMRLFMRGVFAQARRHGLGLELIVVEWNPPADRPRLVEVLPAPKPDEPVTVRYIVVPASLHQRYRRAADIPLFQMIAKNVGIRRATGAFVLCTNVDLLFSDALCGALASTALRPDTYYRANRCDVPDTIDLDADVRVLLAWCEAHVIRRLGRDPRYRRINLELVGLQHKGAFKKWVFDKMAIATTMLWSQEKRRFFQLDSFACGDFTMMAREAWMAVGGYVELDLYSLHIDTLGLVSASALGYRQHVFPAEACTYHVDHPSGWEALSPLERVRFVERRPALDFNLVQEIGLHALASRTPLGLNPPDWGYAGVDLEEHVVAPAAASLPHELAMSGVR